MFLSKAMMQSIFITALFPGFVAWSRYAELISNGMCNFYIFGYIIFCLIPFIFKCSPFLKKELVFLTHVATEPMKVFSSPATVGLYATRNFYITYHDSNEEDAISLGVWHILPNYIVNKFSDELGLNEIEKKCAKTNSHHEQFEEFIDDTEKQMKRKFMKVNGQNEVDFYERLLNYSGAKIVLYLHGSTGSRAKPHRISMYKLLREHGYHVIPFDYCGFGDSIPSFISPNESGLVRDGIAVYKYIIRITNNPVLVWAHSIGTGVGCHLLAKIKRLNLLAPRALVLESPFNNIRDAVHLHPLALPFRFLPWFNYTVVEAIESLGRFQSDKHIATFSQPILILHAEDDLIIPFELGYRLYLAGLNKRPSHWGPITFHRFPAERGYGHLHMNEAPELTDLINEFFEKYINTKF